MSDHRKYWMSHLQHHTNFLLYSGYSSILSFNKRLLYISKKFWINCPSLSLSSFAFTKFTKEKKKQERKWLTLGQDIESKEGEKEKTMVLFIMTRRLSYYFYCLSFLPFIFVRVAFAFFFFYFNFMYHLS